MKMREEEDKGFSWWRLRFWRSEVKKMKEKGEGKVFIGFGL